MSDINLTPVASPDSLKTCWLCQNENGRGGTKNGHVRVEYVRRSRGHEETLANLALGDACAEEVRELAKSLSWIAEFDTAESSPTTGLWVVECCGLCNGGLKEEVRWTTDILIFDDGDIVESRNVTLCERCADVFLEFLRGVGRENQ